MEKVHDDERGYEVGMDENYKAKISHEEGITFANMKRTYDAYQDLDLNRARQVISKEDQFHSLAVQAMQNAIETANMVAKQAIKHGDNKVENSEMTTKQAIRHGDLAIDRQWNVDEQAWAVEAILADETFKEAIGAAVATAVAKSLNK